MGRLIDSDKLKAQVEAHEIIKEFSITEYECGHNEGICMAVDDIEDAETVEAIPTAWIEAEIKKLRDLDFEFATMTAGQIEAMLKKWREEQKDARNHNTGMFSNESLHQL
jgi:hypothetical protein